MLRPKYMWKYSLTNNQYYDKFKDLISNAKHLRSNIGLHTAHVNTILQGIAADPDIPTQEERTHAEEQAKGQHLAAMFLINSTTVPSSGTLRMSTREDWIPTPHHSVPPTVLLSTTMPTRLPMLKLMKEEWHFTLETMIIIWDMDMVDVVMAAAKEVAEEDAEEAVDVEGSNPTSQMRSWHKNECMLREQLMKTKMMCNS
jgi:hypothetical protein